MLPPMVDNYIRPDHWVIRPDQQLARRVFRHTLEGPALEHPTIHTSLMLLLEHLDGEGIHEAVFSGEGYNFIVKWSPTSQPKGG